MGNQAKITNGLGTLLMVVKRVVGEHSVRCHVLQCLNKHCLSNPISFISTRDTHTHLQILCHTISTLVTTLHFYETLSTSLTFL